MKKTLVTIVATLLICGCFAGATYAWLVDKSDPIVNTFTLGNIEIELTETETPETKIIPGMEITRMAEVTVKANSEDCWLFVKVEKSENYGTFMQDYVMAEGWTLLEEGVYYREVALADTDQEFGVLKDNKVVAKLEATKQEYDDQRATAPTLTFTAYAVQKLGVDTAANAWEKAKNLEVQPPAETTQDPHDAQDPQDPQEPQA